MSENNSPLKQLALEVNEDIANLDAIYGTLAAIDDAMREGECPVQSNALYFPLNILGDITERLRAASEQIIAILRGKEQAP